MPATVPNAVLKMSPAPSGLKAQTATKSNVETSGYCPTQTAETFNRTYTSLLLRLGGAFCAVLLVLLWPLICPGSSLQIQIDPQFSGEPIQPNSLRYQTVAGESFSITRISYLLSGFALERSDGTWLEVTNQQAWLDLDAGRNSIDFKSITSGTYRSLRFHVGLAPELNHAKPERFPAGHPLNPNLNGLHWSWQGGYIFMALEGMWKNGSGPYNGWAYHLARDTNRTCINLAVPLDLTQDTKLELALDISALLNAPRPLSFARDGSSTHSRDGDAVAAALVSNLPGAFRVRHVSTGALADPTVTKVQPLYMPVKYTPYPFQMSATFPIPDLPRDNPLINERIALGEELFHDPALSRDGSVSCASCHQSAAAFSDPRRFSVGVENRMGTRQAMPLFNLAWKSSFFWDGRALSLRTQALFPIQDHAEMDQSLTNLVKKLVPTDYPALFTTAFGSPEITPEKIGLALEQFVLTLTSFDSKFDHAMKGEAELSAEEKHGFELFMTEYDPRRNQFGADCFHCHGGPLFQSQSFANNGLDSECLDTGRGKVTGKASDKGKFATPSLRNVALTAPYMHDGRFKTLEEVVEHYSTGVKRSATLDPNIAKHPDGGLHLSDKDKSALVAFLKTLTDERFQQTSTRASR
jgi:cytochrome c peroxidase